MDNELINNDIERKEAKFKWAVLVSSAFMLLCLTMGLTSWSVAVGELSEHLGMTSTQVMLGGSLFVLGFICASGIYGRIIEVIGFKKAGLMGLCVSVIAQFLIPASSSITFILILRFFMGFGMITPPIYYVAGIWFPPKQRGFAIGLLGAMFFFGMSLGGILSGALIPVVGWRATFYIIAGATLVGAIQWAIICRRPLSYEEEQAAEVEAATLDDKAKKDNVFKHSMIWLLALLYFCDFFIVYAMENVTAVFLDDSAYDVRSIGTLVFAVSLLGVAAAPFGGLITDFFVNKSSRQPHSMRAICLLVGGFAMSGLGIFLIPIIGMKGFALCAICMLIIGWGDGFMDSTATVVGIDAMGPEKGDKAVGYMIFLGGIGGVISPIFINWIGGSVGWTVAWVVLGIAAIIGIIDCLVISRKHVEHDKM